MLWSSGYHPQTGFQEIINVGQGLMTMAWGSTQYVLDLWSTEARMQHKQSVIIIIVIIIIKTVHNVQYIQIKRN